MLWGILWWWPVNNSYYLIIADANGLEVSREEFQIAVANKVKDKNNIDPDAIEYF